MNLINRIEINYFRSIYSSHLSNIKDLSIIVGGNDVGKSNYLRALNLFFNNETNYDEELDFLQDVTHLRQQEAASTKGRLTIWIKLHFNNIFGWSTLPNKFYIKKTWNRYTEYPEVKSDIKNKQSLTRFMNKVEFHYIPAVKDPDIFSYYLVLLYETLAKRQDISFERQASELSTAIGTATNRMSERIQTKIGVKSSIRVPTDLETIFEKLEFSTKQGKRDVPLQNRGDGIQARHIPHILDYISRNNGKKNIWGYEEPENSLEMGNSFLLAKEFLDSFSQNNQVFITSHSPAFYNLSGDRVTTFSAKKAEKISSNEVHQITEFRKLDSVLEMDSELGIANLIAKRSEALHKSIENLKLTNSILSEQIKPIVLTEGSTDSTILQIAWSKLYPSEEMPFVVKSCDVGTEQEEKAGADQLQAILESTNKDSPVLRIGVFDNDDKGRKCFNRMKRHSTFELFNTVKFNDNRRSCAFLLPDIQWEDNYFPLTRNELPIEMMFNRADVHDDFIEYTFQSKDGNISKLNADKIIKKLADDHELLKTCITVKIKFLNKAQFAQSVKKFSKDKFNNFIPIFDTIRYCLNDLTAHN